MSSDAHFPQVDMNIYGLSEKSLILTFLNGTLSEIKVQKLLLGAVPFQKVHLYLKGPFWYLFKGVYIST